MSLVHRCLCNAEEISLEITLNWLNFIVHNKKIFFIKLNILSNQILKLSLGKESCLMKN